jgi:hypothetical protein
MSGLGPSPLYAAAAVAWPPGVEIPEPVMAELVAWLQHHCGGWATEDLYRFVVTDAELHVWRLGEPGGPLGGAVARRPINGPAVAPLRSHPSVALLNGLAAAGVLACAAVVQDETGAVSWRCNVLVDAYGRHRGPHLDGTFGDEAEWPNMNDADQPAPRPPAAAVPSLAAIRGVMAGALWLCHHDPGHPLSYTDPDTCKTCLAIDRAAAAVHAMIGANP